MAGETKISDDPGCIFTGTNSVFSEHSFYCLLEMLLNGASGNVKKELDDVMKGKTFLNNGCALF